MSLRRASACSVLALAIASVVIGLTPGYRPAGDSADYVRHAISIAHGHGYPRAGFGVYRPHPAGPTAFRPPLYPFVLGATFALSGDSLTAGRLVTAGLGAIAIALIFLVADELWGPRVATIAGLLAAVFPPLIALDAGLFSEPLFVCLEMGALLFALRVRSRRSRWANAIAAGALAGLAALTRGNGWLLIALVALAAGLPGRPWQHRALRATTALAVALLVAAPWLVRNAIVFHRFVPVSTETGFTMIQTFNARSLHDNAEARIDLPGLPATLNQPRRNEAQIDAKLTGLALSFAARHPLYSVQAVSLNALRTLGIWPGRLAGAFSYEGNGLSLRDPFRQLVLWSVYPAYLFALLGVWALARMRRASRPPGWFWLFPLALVLSAGFAAGAARYRAPVDPFTICLAGLGISALLAPRFRVLRPGSAGPASAADRRAGSN